MLKAHNQTTNDVGFLCYGDEENGHRARTNGHLATVNQSEIHRAYCVSVQKDIKILLYRQKMRKRKYKMTKTKAKLDGLLLEMHKEKRRIFKEDRRILYVHSTSGLL